MSSSLVKCPGCKPTAQNQGRLWRLRNKMGNSPEEVHTVCGALCCSRSPMCSSPSAALKPVLGCYPGLSTRIIRCYTQILVIDRFNKAREKTGATHFCLRMTQNSDLWAMSNHARTVWLQDTWVRVRVTIFRFCPHLGLAVPFCAAPLL